MKKTMLLIALFLSSQVALANNPQTIIQHELANVVLTKDMREKVLSTNRIIALGDSAVALLSQYLSNPNADLSAKWSAAMALGEINNSQALPALENCLNANNSWLKSICENSIAIIKGEKERAGKIYLLTFGLEKTRTDVEAGTTEVIP